LLVAVFCVLLLPLSLFRTKTDPVVAVFTTFSNSLEGNHTTINTFGEDTTLGDRDAESPPLLGEWD